MNKKIRGLFIALCPLFLACHQSVDMDFALVYYAGEGGSILEPQNSIQVVYRGHDGAAVTAEPNQGYAFYSWSDGVKTATRQEKNVQASVSVTAYFVLLENGA